MAESARPSPASPGDPALDERAEWRGLKGDVEGLADEAAERGRGLMDAARAQAQTYVERRKSDAAQSVHDLAQTLRGSGKELEDKPNIRAFFDSAADGLEQLGSSIENRSFQQIYGEAEAFARRAPVAVAIGTFVAGLVAARFIKSSGLPPEYPREGFPRPAPYPGDPNDDLGTGLGRGLSRDGGGDPDRGLHQAAPRGTYRT